MDKRRNIIKSAGLIFGMSAVSSSGATARQIDHRLPSGFRSKIIKRYGRKEGRKIIDIVQGPYEKLEKGKLERDNFRNVVTEAILKDESLQGIENDLIREWSQKPPHHQIKESTWPIEENIEEINESNSDSIMVQDKGKEWLLPSNPKYGEESMSSIAISNNTPTTLSNGPEWVRLRNSETDKQNSGAAISGSVVDPIRWCDPSYPGCFENDGHLRTHAKAVLYGSGWGHSRGYLRFNPHKDGNRTITVQYRIDGNSDTGATKLSIFARRHSDGAINSKIIDEPVTVPSEERSRYKKFDFDSDDKYDVGVELYSVANASGSANSSDYYSSDNANGHRGAMIRKHDDHRLSIKISND